MLKKDIKTIKKGKINYILKGNKKVRFKPWLGDLFSFSYDNIMAKSVFPKKFEASIEKHTEFLQNEFENYHGKNILELATGSGNLSEIIANDNNYAGIDISNGLLKIADKKFKQNGFNKADFFICSADELPFEDDFFDVCICNLSLNFFNDIEKVIMEIKRVLNSKGEFICSVPIPERNSKNSVIHGTLHTETELKELFEKNGLSFEVYDFQNGTLLYFKCMSI